ncbi:type II toxin-antitoxin system VapC family toxin [Marinibaculum pumilum]|uniref:Ribonuclease VapC n=1 Tax=Marinibaculum pumilum TaxID=1766165 RepID=A0ABV7KZZ3_9PROT
MIVDASALLAILLDEPEGAAFANAIAADPHPLMSAVNWLEAAIRVDGSGDLLAVQDFEALVEASRIAVLPVTMAQAQEARRAYARFGKGRHPASLNFGDCFAYALARERAEPLLFKGQDFSRTDITPAA